jgi:hypothetical protein
MRLIVLIRCPPHSGSGGGQAGSWIALKKCLFHGPIKLAHPHSATSLMLPALSAGGTSALLASLRMRASTQPKRQKYFFISLFLRLLFAIFNVNHVELVGKAGG